MAQHAAIALSPTAHHWRNGTPRGWVFLHNIDEIGTPLFDQPTS
jgi:hypothetical protein